MKTYLIDDLLSNTTEIKGKWWIAKPMLNPFLWNRIKLAWLIITGEATAIHFKSDEK